MRIGATSRATDLAKSPEAAAIFLKDGATLTNPDLARTLEAIASDGWYGFYDGEVARELVRYSDANDGFFTPDDLKAQVARWGEPLKGSYRDVTIYETPAPTQGFAVLEMLNLLEPLELHRKPFLGPDCGASDGAGQAARLSRPRPPSRRSALRRRADGTADLQGLCRRTARA